MVILDTYPPPQVERFTKKLIPKKKIPSFLLALPETSSNSLVSPWWGAGVGEASAACGDADTARADPESPCVRSRVCVYQNIYANS